MERFTTNNTGNIVDPMAVDMIQRLQKQLADAQATIAALQADNRTYINERHEHVKQIEQLQARVQELEAQHEDLVERNRILRHRPDLPVERTELHDRFVKLQSQLTQRTAELEAAKADFVDASTDRDDWITSWRVLQRHNERIEAELERVRGELVWANQCRQDAAAMTEQLTGEVTTLRTLLLTLPKVEGEIDVSSGVYNFILLKHDSGTRFLCGQIETEQTARAIAALWQHRQGMEG